MDDADSSMPEIGMLDSPHCKSRERVARAISALSDDFERQGGILHQRQVDRHLDRRHLTPDECSAVFAGLISAGIRIEDPIIGPVPTEPEFGKSLLRPGNTSFDSLATLMADVRVSQLLTAQEEIDLSRAITLGDRAKQALADSGERGDRETREIISRGNSARERMIVSNLKLVLGIAFRYRT
jgi:RNA polymerase primary sigma factor